MPAAPPPPARIPGECRLLAAVALSVLLGACALPPAPPPPPPRDGAFDKVMSVDAFDNELLSRAILYQSNVVRMAHGVPPLAPSPALDAAADEQAAYMALALQAEHDNPFPHRHTVIDRVERAGLNGTLVGENAIMMPATRLAADAGPAYTYATYAAFLVEGWMNSPDHRANLLERRFTYLGCGARLAHGFHRGDLSVFATQVFFLPFQGDPGAGRGAEQ